MTANESAQTRERRRAFREWVVILVCTLAALLLGTGLYFYLRDESPPDDSDFQPAAKVVPLADDGIAQLRNLDPYNFGIVRFARKRGLPPAEVQAFVTGTTVNDAAAQDYLKYLEPDFTEIDRILSLPYFGSYSAHSIYNDSKEAQLLRAVGEATQFTTSHRQRAGDYAGAVTDVLRLRRLAARFTEAQVPKGDVLNAIRANVYVARGYVNLLNDPVLPPTELARLQTGWGKAQWNQTLGLSLNGEYQFFGVVIRSVQSQPLMNSSRLRGSHVVEDYWIQVNMRENEARHEMSDYFRAVRAALAKNYTDIDQTAIRAPAFGGSSSFAAGKYLAPNYGGRALFRNEIRVWPEYIGDAFTATATDRLVETGLALRHYYDDHHALPTKLEDLTPSYLPAVLLDPFDGKPLRYNAARGLIYSIGTLLRDEGGSKRPVKNTYSESDDPLNDSAQPTLQLTFQNLPTKTP